jgi:hypothetical protein
MEECVRRNEAEGKEINPVTCTFVNKCKPGETRNEKGRCVKGRTKTKTKPNAVEFAPFVYAKPLEVKKKQSFTRKKAKAIPRKNGNNYSYNIGYAGRVIKPGALYSFNNEGKRGNKKETRNSLNIERAKRGIVVQRKTRQSANEKRAKESPEAIQQLEEELAEGNVTNMRPLQMRKRRAKAEELKRKKAAELAGKGRPLGEPNSSHNYMRNPNTSL